MNLLGFTDLNNLNYDNDNPEPIDCEFDLRSTKVASCKFRSGAGYPVFHTLYETQG